MARRAYARITIEGQDVTAMLEPYIIGFSYSDSIENEADVAALELADPTGIWSSAWFPTRGSIARVELVKEDWNEEGTIETFPIGIMEIDECTAEYPPMQFCLKLCSVTNGSGVRGVDRFRSWEKTTLRQIAGDIANDSGMGLFFDAEDFQLERVEQSQESSIALLRKLCADNGLVLKVSDNTIIIVDAQKYEAQPAVTTLYYGSSAIKTFQATASISKIYSDVNVYHRNNSIADFFLGTFEMFAGNAGVNVRGITEGLARGAGSVVRTITQKVSSEAEARRLAKNKLRESNKEEWRLTVVLVGDFIYTAGNVINLANFGAWSGNFIIDKSTHKISQSGYETAIECHRCLVGY